MGNNKKEEAMMKYFIYIVLFFQVTSCLSPGAFWTRNKNKLEILLNDHNVKLSYTLHNGVIDIVILNRSEMIILTDISSLKISELMDGNNTKDLMVSNELDDSSIEFPLSTIKILPGDSLSLKLKFPDLMNSNNLFLKFNYVASENMNLEITTNIDYKMSIQSVGVKIKLQ